MKTLFRIVLIVLVVLAVLVLVRDAFVKAAVQGGVKVATGLTLKIEKLHIGLSNTLIQVTGIQLMNPKGFEEPVMVSIPDIYVDYSLRSFLKGAPRFHVVRVTLEEFNVVRSADGRLNLDTFKALSQAKKGDASGGSKPEKPLPNLISVGLLGIQIDRVSYKDYSAEPPRIQDFNIGLKEEFMELPNVRSIVKIIFKKAMGSSIASLANVDLGELKDEALSAASEQGVALAGAAQDQAGQALESAAESLKGVAGGLGGKLKMPFGGGAEEETSIPEEESPSVEEPVSPEAVPGAV